MRQLQIKFVTLTQVVATQASDSPLGRSLHLMRCTWSLVVLGVVLKVPVGIGTDHSPASKHVALSISKPTGLT